MVGPEVGPSPVFVVPAFVCLWHASQAVIIPLKISQSLSEHFVLPIPVWT